MNDILPALFVFACLLTLAAPPASAEDSTTLYWVFLNRGHNKTHLTAEEGQRMQAAHVGNLGALGEQGKGLMAGPLGDNDTIRGTVVLTVKTVEEVADCFRTDPYVQNDYLSVEAYRWLADRRKFHKPNTPFKIAQYTLGIVKKGPHWEPPTGEIRADSLAKAVPSIKQLSRSHDLAVSGPLLDAKETIGILLFRTADQNKLRAILDQDPEAKAGHIIVELHEQWLGEGTLAK